MLWVKAFHVVAVITWFSALFYLPRLFVYHAMSDDTVSRERFKTMERKLYRGIAVPSMVATLVLGAWTASYNWAYYSGATWFWLKMALVASLLVYHHICGFYVRGFAKDQVKHSHVYFRWFNEFPVVPLVGIVLLAVVKLPA